MQLSRADSDFSTHTELGTVIEGGRSVGDYRSGIKAGMNLKQLTLLGGWSSQAIVEKVYIDLIASDVAEASTTFQLSNRRTAPALPTPA